MKRHIALIAVVILASFAISGIASADVQKVSLVPWAGYDGPGTGFVIFGNSTNPTNNLHITVSLKKSDPSDLGSNELAVWLRYDDDDDPSNVGWAQIGTLTLNAKGNGTCHINTSVPTDTTLWFWLGVFPIPGPPNSKWVTPQAPYASLSFK